MRWKCQHHRLFELLWAVRWNTQLLVDSCWWSNFFNHRSFYQVNGWTNQNFQHRLWIAETFGDLHPSSRLVPMRQEELLLRLTAWMSWSVVRVAQSPWISTGRRSPRAPAAGVCIAHSARGCSSPIWSLPTNHCETAKQNTSNRSWFDSMTELVVDSQPFWAWVRRNSAPWKISVKALTMALFWIMSESNNVTFMPCYAHKDLLCAICILYLLVVRPPCSYIPIAGCL